MSFSFIYSFMDIHLTSFDIHLIYLDIFRYSIFQELQGIFIAGRCGLVRSSGFCPQVLQIRWIASEALPLHLRFKARPCPSSLCNFINSTMIGSWTIRAKTWCDVFAVCVRVRAFLNLSSLSRRAFSCHTSNLYQAAFKAQNGFDYTEGILRLQAQLLL